MNKRKIIRFIIWTIFLIGLAVAILNFQMIKDLYFATIFSPSYEISDINEELDLTDKGHRIFYASSPVLSDAKEFNEKCNTTEGTVSTLGCYNGQKIYIYNIESEELEGVKQSTAAHELLHAVWARLSTAERENLIPTLESVYGKSDDEFKKSLKTYSESAKTEEIYVRAATQIKDLPQSLEDHYAEIFKNQDKIVDFYNSYITPFNSLEAEIDALTEELNQLNSEIEAGRSDYGSRSSALSTAINEFNNCASTAGCFASNYAFQTRRAELVSEQSALNDLYNDLNAKIDTYNQKVELYNSKVFRGRELNSIINSNQPVIEEITK